MAPTYAIIFMHELETRILNSVPLRPFIWLRFIDDVFSVWCHGEKSLEEFRNLVNSYHPAIKFTETHSTVSVPFLDVMVEKGQNGEIITDLYTKPTDTHLYLVPTSCHPGSVKKSIAYSQAIRILSICSSRETALLRLDTLLDHLVARGHSKRKVRKQIIKAIRYFDTPPADRAPKTSDRVNFVQDFHPGLPNINRILRENHHLLQLNPNLRKVMPEPPRLAFRRPKNLRNYLCRGRLPPLGTPDNLRPSNSCGPCSIRKSSQIRRGPPCGICKLLPSQNCIVSFSNGKNFSIVSKTNADCDSKFVVYCLSCTKCGLQYVGRAQNFRLRVNNHKSCINRKCGNDSGCRLLYEHFSAADHSLQNVKFTVLQVCTDSETMCEAEIRWIWSLGTLEPKGFNIDDGFSVQTTRSRRR